MRHDYFKTDTYCFGVADLENLVVMAEELDMPDWAYEELQDTIATARSGGDEVSITMFYGVKDGNAEVGQIGYGSDEFISWLFRQGIRLCKQES